MVELADIPEAQPLVFVLTSGEYRIPADHLAQYLRFDPQQLEAVAAMRAAGIAESVIDSAFPPQIAPPAPLPAPAVAAPGAVPAVAPPPVTPGQPPVRSIPRPGPCAARNGNPHLPVKYALNPDHTVDGICSCGHRFPTLCPHMKTTGPGVGQVGDVVCTWCQKVMIRRTGFIDNRNAQWGGRSRTGAADPSKGVRVLQSGDQPAPDLFRGDAADG